LFSAQHIEAARRFNDRLREHNGDPAFLLPEQVAPRQSVPEGTPFLTRQWILVERTADAPDEARGGVLLQEMDCWLGGTVRRTANIQTPVTEGSFQRAKAQLGLALLREISDRFPLLYAVGMGALDKPFPKLLAALRWHVSLSPFFFRVGKGSRFLTELAPLRKPGAVKWAASIGAASGLGGPVARLGLAALGWKQRGFAGIEPLQAVESPWGEWSTEIWEKAKPGISCGAVRDFRTLPNLYGGGGRTQTFRLNDKSGTAVGWVVLLCTPMQGGHFGHLRVGTIVDALTRPGYETAAIRAASARLLEMGAELLITNHTHPAWITALQQNGYFPGPSNYVFAASPPMVNAWKETDPDGLRRFITRGDGDGRIHL
jgi:hypothetical protein